MLTEKTLNMILGCNFPILLCGKDSVKHLEFLGFDVFRDLVDHSYDDIADPMERLISAINLNRKLLVDQEWSQQQWIANKERFIKNAKHAKQGMYDVVKDRVLRKFKSVFTD
jgi:hypothetical protein